MQDEIGIILFSSVLCLSGVTSFILGYRKMSVFDHIKKIGIRTVGVVEQVVKPSIGGGYLPIVKFYTDNEEVIGIPKNSIQSIPTWYEAGEKFTTYYHPHNPSKFVIEKGTEKAAAWFLIVVGMLCFGSSLYLYLDKI